MNERIISSGDAEICTEAFGNPDNPALLLVIGASASMLRWDEQLIARFTAAGYYAIRFDNTNLCQKTKQINLTKNGSSAPMEEEFKTPGGTSC